VEIDPSKIVGSLVDVSTPEGRIAAGFNPRDMSTWSYAASDQEVLLDGYVPPEAIIRFVPGTVQMELPFEEC
jgi:hypothetical protein